MTLYRLLALLNAFTERFVGKHEIVQAVGFACYQEHEKQLYQDIREDSHSAAEPIKHFLQYRHERREENSRGDSELRHWHKEHEQRETAYARDVKAFFE